MGSTQIRFDVIFESPQGMWPDVSAKDSDFEMVEDHTTLGGRGF